jgi:death on curing protein
MASGIEYLSVDQVIALHRRAIELYGGLDGIRSEHQLASAVFQPQASAFGADAYPSITEKAAAYGYFLAESQSFIDGNKRTAALAMITFLHGNGFELVPSNDDELAELFENLGGDTIDQRGFFDWVITHVQPLSSDE